MSLLEALKWRYATKKFDISKVIPVKDIDKIKAGFNLSATSYGLQPVSLILVCNKTIQRELVPLSRQGYQFSLDGFIAY